MRVLVLGGAGEVGRHVSRDLACHLDAEDLVVADVDRGRARQAFDTALPDAVRVVEVDVRDRRQLAGALAGVDVVVNCTPLAWFDTVLAAALEAEVDYVDIGSEPTEAQRDAFAATSATAVSGLGLAPGTSNVLCAHAASDLDAVEELEVSWASFRSIAPSEGGLDTILRAVREDCPTRQTFRNGRYVWSAPLDASRVVTFPEPFGPQRVFVVPESETVTLPRNLPGLTHAVVRGTWGPHTMADLPVLNRYGLLDVEPLAGPETLTAFDATRSRILMKLGGRRDPFHLWGFFLVVDVIGTRAGDVVHRQYRVWHDDWGTFGPGRMAGINASVGVILFLRNREGIAPGFVDPECLFDPDDYLTELKSRDGIYVDHSEARVSQRPVERIG